MKKVFLCFCLIISLCFPGCSFNSSAKNLSLTIVHTNDVHGRVIYDEENEVAGYSKINNFISKIKKQKSNTLLVDAGDVLHGQPIATVPKGSSIVEIMNLMGYNFFVPGNHDFNYGFTRLEELSKTMKFKILASNLKKQDGSRPFVENDIIKFDNVNIGVFGLVTPETAVKTNPKNVEGLSFESPVDSAKEQVKKLKEKGADLIFAIAHLGIDDESMGNRSYDVRDAVDGLDLIIDGHSHSTLNKIKQVEGKAVITSSGAYAENLGVVEISIENGKKTITPKNFLYEELKNTENDSEIDNLVSKINDELSPLLNQVIGKTEVDLEGKKSAVRSHETNLTKLVTDAILKETKADLVLVNGGGFRDSLYKGEIKQSDIIRVFPFGNYVITKAVKGQDIIDSLELGFEAYPSPAGKLPQLAGISCTVDASAQSGSKVKSVTIGGNKIDPNKEYILATNDFVANGGDGYTLIGNSKEVNHFSALDEIFINYVKSITPITEDMLNKLSTRHNIINSK